MTNRLSRNNFSEKGPREIALVLDRDFKLVFTLRGAGDQLWVSVFGRNCTCGRRGGIVPKMEQYRLENRSFIKYIPFAVGAH